MFRPAAVLVGLLISIGFLTPSAFAQCPIPSTANTVTFCTPTNNSTINGPVEVSAAANVSGFTLLRVYDNMEPVYEAPMQSVDTFLYVGSGTHVVSVIAYTSTGGVAQQDITINVVQGAAGQPCGVPQTDKTINICFPTSNQVVSGSPLTLSAYARWDCCAISHIRFYVDNQDSFDQAGGPPIVFTRNISLLPGTHNLVGVAWNNQGQFIKNSATINVADTNCIPTGAATFCFPNNNDTVPSPVQITAASATPDLTLLRLYDNNQKIFETKNTSFNTSLAIGQGLHHLVLVAYDTKGNAMTDQRFIRVTGTGSLFPCGIPESGRDINICSPAEFDTTVTSPVTISAQAQWNGQVISHIRVYLDHQDVFDADSQTWVNKQFTLPSGGHTLTVTVWDNHGDHTSVGRTFFVQ